MNSVTAGVTQLLTDNQLLGSGRLLSSSSLRSTPLLVCDSISGELDVHMKLCSDYVLLSQAAMSGTFINDVPPDNV